MVDGYLVVSYQDLSNHFLTFIKRHAEDVRVEGDPTLGFNKEEFYVQEILDGLKVLFVKQFLLLLFFFLGFNSPLSRLLAASSGCDSSAAGSLVLSPDVSSAGALSESGP